MFLRYVPGDFRMGRNSSTSFLSKHFLDWFPSQSTLKAENVPLLYREPGIHTRYRPLGKPVTYYVISMFKIHNESVNIWTHLVAAILFVFKLRLVLTHAEEDGIFQNILTTFVAFGFCSVAYTLSSALAHTLHSKSPFWHYICFQIDYCGIGLYGLGKCILLLHSTCPDTVYVKIRSYYLLMNVVFGWVLMFGCCFAKLRYRRPYPFRRKVIQLLSGVLQAVFGVIPLASRYVICFRDPTCHVISTLQHHNIWLMTLFISLLFFSSHQPEKKYPGHFDFIGQGHQIFHVLIATTTFLQYDAAYTDVITREQRRQASGYELFSAITLYMAGSVCIILFLSTFVKRRVEEDAKMK